MQGTTSQDAPRVLADRYELHARLGTGGAGTVWRGYDRALDRHVAVKLLHADLAHDPAAAARFRTEATAAAKLTHPNAVLVYDLGRDHGDDYLVMELVEGRSLAELLQHGPLPAGLGAAVGAQVAGALGVAHGVGFVHRDVKPANVLVTYGGSAKLADFGIARVLGEVTSRLTRTGMVLGTARYLAPEQLRDDPVDARADVYALGLVLHEALTARPPFGEGGPIEVASRRLTSSLPSLADVADVPRGLSDVVDWATARDPHERPTDGAELANALLPFAAHDAADALAALVRRSGEAPGTVTASGSAAGSTPAAPGPLALPTDGTQVLGSRTTGTQVGPDAGPAGGPAPGRAEATAALGSLPSATPSTSGSRERRPLGWALVALLTLAAVAIVAVVVTQVPDGGDDGPPAAATEEAEQTALTIQEADYHAPVGDPENPDQVPNAYDGDAGTVWTTQGYNTAQFGGLKDGVGLWVALEERVRLERLHVRFGTPGGALEVWVDDDPPPAGTMPGDGWGTKVGEGAIESERIRFDFDEVEVPARTVLLWFTELPRYGTDGRYRAAVADLELHGST